MNALHYKMSVNYEGIQCFEVYNRWNSPDFFVDLEDSTFETRVLGGWLYGSFGLKVCQLQVEQARGSLIHGEGTLGMVLPRGDTNSMTKPCTVWKT